MAQPYQLMPNVAAASSTINIELIACAITTRRCVNFAQWLFALL